MTNIHLTDTEADKEKLFKRVLETVNKAMKESLHTVEGAPQASLLMPDDTYRTKPVFGDQELFFKDVRVGKSGKIIFSFTPVDDMPWKQCEWNAKDLDQAVPLFGSVLAEKLGYETENLPTLMAQLIEKTGEQILEEHELERAAAVQVHSENPKFGKF